MKSSKSRASFEANFLDIARLIDLHETMVELEKPLDEKDDPSDFTGHKCVVLNSAIVLMVSHWEAYVEDICAEALSHIVNNIQSSDNLPKELKKRIALELRESKNELQVWDISDGKWKYLLKSRLDVYKEQRNRKFNSAKSELVKQFFHQYLGIKDVTKNWSYEKLTPTECCKLLDEIVEVRGAIAHRGKPPKEITLTRTKEYSAFLKKIIAKTGGTVNTCVKNICNTGLF